MRTLWPAMTVTCVLLAGGVAHAEASAAQPSKLAAERAEGLTKDVKNFTLRLDFHPLGCPDRLCLHLSVPALPEQRETVHYLLEAQMTEDEARKVINYLAAEGFLGRAKPPSPPVKGGETPDPSYSLDVSGLYYEDLGWGLPMLHRLDGLRKVLGGDAAKSMDRFLAGLSWQRTEWEKQAAALPATPAAGVGDKAAVYAKVVLPSDKPVVGDYPVDAWIAQDLGRRGRANLRAVSPWVRLGEKGGDTQETDLWDGNLDGKTWGCPASATVARRTDDGHLTVAISGFSPGVVTVEGTTLSAKPGSRGIAEVEKGQAYVALHVGLPPAATPPAALADAVRMAKVPVVFRVKWKSLSPPGGNPSDTVTVLQIIKNESGKVWGPQARIDHDPGKEGVPQDKECTVYLEVSEVLRGKPWALLGGGAETGVSHVGAVPNP